MTRAYTMDARAAGVRARREAILAAAFELLMTGSLDELTLESVATRAGVSLKTVQRQFNSRSELLSATIRARRAEEERLRAVPVGDVDAVVRVLASRYEQLLDVVPRLYALEEQVAAVADLRRAGVVSHTAWLEQVFAPVLPARGRERKVWLLALYGATELSVWWMWRRQLGASKAAAKAAMREQLEALLERWQAHEGLGG